MFSLLLGTSALVSADNCYLEVEVSMAGSRSCDVVVKNFCGACMDI